MLRLDWALVPFDKLLRAWAAGSLTRCHCALSSHAQLESGRSTRGPVTSSGPKVKVIHPCFFLRCACKLKARAPTSAFLEPVLSPKHIIRSVGTLYMPVCQSAAQSICNC
jgi:hypothetical protein